jgi:SAM-dependent methyltransferase
VTIDHYATAGRRWAEGASLVYGPIARQLVARSPHPLAGRVVLDAGAGTGVACAALGAMGARPLAIDLSHDMLVFNAASRPPAAVADIRALPFVEDVVDDSVAAFVLNHLVEPADGFAELVSVTRPGGALLACVYSNASRSEARDVIDETARHQGWHVPDWYLEIKTRAAPRLGTADAMAGAAKAAGLADVRVDELAVDVGVTEPEQLVNYRFGQAHFSDWLERIGPASAKEIRSRAVDAVRPIMRPYRPIVVFLAATVPKGRVARRSRL